MKMPSYVGIVLTILGVLPLRTEPQGLCSRQLDIALIIDQSGSILTDSNGNRVWHDYILEIAASLVHVLPIGPDMVRLGVVKFSTNAHVAINLDEYEDTVSLELAVRDLEYGGGETNIAEGLSVGRKLLYDSDIGARNGVKKIAVLISDGRANLERNRTQLEGNSTRKAGVEIFCIGVTNQTNELELKGIASQPTSTHYYFVTDRNVLNKTIASILAELCAVHEPLPNLTESTSTTSTLTAQSTSTYSTIPSASASTPTIHSNSTTTVAATLFTSTTSISTTRSTTASATTPSTPTRNASTETSSTLTQIIMESTASYNRTSPSSTSISTTLSIGNTTMSSTQTSSQILSTAPTLHSTTPRPTCSKRADIVLIIDDSSDEVLNGYNWYDFIRGFAIGVINVLPIAPDKVRMGLITYDTVARVAINLGQHKDVVSLERAIRNLMFQNGDRNTADALNAGRNLLFSPKRGARRGLDKVAFLITNGRSTSNRALTQWEANITKSAGIEIFSSGVTNQVDETELRALASDPTSRHYYYEPDYNSVPRLVDRLLTEYCTPSTMTPSSSVASTTTSTTFGEITRPPNATSQHDIVVNTSNIGATTTETTTRPNISATTTATSEASNLTNQITLTTTAIPTTPSTSTSTIQSSYTMITTPTTSTTITQATQSNSTTNSSSTILFTSTSAPQSTSTDITIPAAPTYTSNIQSTSIGTIPSTQSTSTISSLTTQSTSTTSAIPPVAPVNRISTIQSTSTAITSTQSTSTTRTLTTPSTSTTSTIQAAPTTSTSTIQSTSTTTRILSLSTSTTSTSATRRTSARTTTPTTPTGSASTTTTSTAPTSKLTTDSITETTETTTPTTTVIPCPKEIDIVLILDETTSIVAAPGGYGNWHGYILGFAEGFINAFQVDPEFVRIGVVKFSWFARIIITLDQYSDAAGLVKAVRSLEIDGGQTNIAAGLQVGRSLLFNTSLGAREGAKKMAFLVTDGRANVQYEMTQPEANITKAAGVEIYCIGVTSMIYEVELKGIASAPISTHYYFVTDYNMLSQVLEKLRGTICFALQLSSTTIVTTSTRTV